MKNTYTRAFTIIELLIVIAIIGILTGVILTSLSSSRSKARDVKRVSDMGQIQLALELYYDRCKHYPASAGAVDVNDATCTLKITDFISAIPTPPTGIFTNNGYYKYYTNGSPPNTFILSTRLENATELLDDGYSYNNQLNSPVPPIADKNICTNKSGSNIGGVVQYHYCLGPK